MKKLTVEANIDNLDAVVDFVNGELEHKNYPPELLININLAVEEIFMNIAHHAYCPGSGSVAIAISVGDETVIRFEDTGKPYNPLEHPDPDLDKSLMEREIGGLGIFLVKQVMDQVDYIRIDNKNVLTVTKKFAEHTA